ncbi:MAG: diguanylate cyclase [Candidatus Omnitrophica bacterium]|nr:diguanylate cyclase [Candidatus Omnitrophota bacterium]
MKKQSSKRVSFASRGLKYKLRLALYLMAVLPLLVSVYLVSNYILPRFGLRFEVMATLGISFFVAFLGFFVIKQVFDRILSVSTEAKMIAAGDITRKLDIEREDEVGDLGDALNQLTNRIRNNMDELKNYSEKTTEINLEIQKRILVLSSLLQISSLITQSAKLEEILKLTVEKSRFIANSDLAFLLFRDENKAVFHTKIADGPNAQHLYKLEAEFEEAMLSKLAKTGRPLILDKDNPQPENVKSLFLEQFRLRNVLALPIYLRGRLVGLLGVGNIKEQFNFMKDDIELLDVFAKQIAIAVENDLLLHRIEKLEIKDALTGLYNETFIHNRLQEEIKRAITYQRPCAYVLLNLDNFRKFHDNFGSLQTEAALKRVAAIIRESVTEIDRVGRIGDNEFAIVLPEKNKRQAQTIAEEIRKKIEFVFSEEQDNNKKITCSGGVSENPLDGVEAEELVARAKDRANHAKQQGKNRIAV